VERAVPPAPEGGARESTIDACPWRCHSARVSCDRGREGGGEKERERRRRRRTMLDRVAGWLDVREPHAEAGSGNERQGVSGSRKKRKMIRPLLWS